MKLQSERDVSQESRVKIRKIGPYILIKPIGKGSYSTVYEGKIETKGTKVAIKQITLEKIKKKELKRLQFEIKILTLIKHQNIVNLLDYKESSRNLYLIFQHCQHTDLEKHIKKYYNGKMPQTNVKNIFLQIKKAFQVLRTNKIVHRDLKLANIMLTEDFTIKVADFGFARLLQENSLFKSFVGTPMTMAPEVLQKKDYDEKCDIWSLGIILYQMLKGRTPFVDPGHMTVQMLIQNIKTRQIFFDSQDNLSQSVKDLIKRMLVIDPKQRMTFQQFFNHEWLHVTQSSDVMLQLRDMMLEKEVGKSAYFKSSKSDLMGSLKYLDKILVYSFFHTIKEKYQNIIYQNFTLAKRLMALLSEQQDQVAKQLLCVGLLIIMNNIKQTQEQPQTLILNNVSIQVYSYNVMKQIKIHEQSIFSKTLPSLAKKVMSSAVETIQTLLHLPHIKKMIQNNSVLLKEYIRLVITYLQSQPKRQLMGVLSSIRPVKLNYLKLQSQFLSKDTLKIINKPVIWNNLASIDELVKDSEFMKIYNSKKKLFKIQVLSGNKQPQKALIQDFYQTFKSFS